MFCLKLMKVNLKRKLNQAILKNAYLLYGEESYLKKEYYANELKNKIVDKTF